jgi:hypothetical protein
MYLNVYYCSDNSKQGHENVFSLRRILASNPVSKLENNPFSAVDYC